MAVQGRIMILYIEDDAATACLVREKLEQCGYFIELAENGAKALEKFNPALHNLVISDYQLPDMNGCQIINAIREKNNLVPIIILTGVGNEKIVLEAFRLGIADYLIKDSSSVFIELLPNIIASVLFIKDLVQENSRQQKELEYYSRELEGRNKELQKLAQYDTLTGLANRAVFHETLQGAIARAARNNSNMALMSIDVDRFKLVNDTHGHPAGDIVLKRISARFKASLRESDHIARIGGDEFAIILENLARPEDAMVVADKLIKRMRYPVKIENEKIRVSISMGIDSYPYCGQDAEHLIKNADEAMYMAKKKGKNSYQFFTQELNRQAIEFMALGKDLSGALKRNELFLHFQPKYSRDTFSIVGAEALIRWNHPVKGLIEPDVFIPIAERTILIQEIGMWVLETACKQGTLWHKKDLPELLISVNISPYQLKEKNFAEQVFNTLETCKFDPRFLELEITETSLLNNIDRCRESLVALRKEGIKISIDDFGTGYSSIAHLRQLPVDILKIDKSMVRNITVSRDEAALASAVIDLAHNINLKVVAEGVETKEQLKFLQDKNCDTLQGYFLNRPMLADDLTTFLKRAA